MYLNLILKVTLYYMSCGIKIYTSEKSLSLILLFLSTKACGFLKELYVLYLPCRWRSMLASASNYSYFCSIYKMHPDQHLKILPWKPSTILRETAENKIGVMLPFFLPSK